MRGRDDAVFRLLAERGEKMLPFYRSMVVWKDLYTTWGGEFDWTYNARGILSFLVQGQNSPLGRVYSVSAQAEAFQQGYAFAHARQTEGFALLERLLDVEADAVIFNNQLQKSIGGGQGNVYEGGGRVLADVVKAFLDQTIGDHFRLLRKSTHLVELELHAAVVEPLEPVDQLAQRGAQTELFEDRRTESSNQAPHFENRAFSQIAGVAELMPPIALAFRQGLLQ